MSIKDEKIDNESYSKNFTRTPNVLFVAYSDLSREEKYLYINLRRIYWDMKPRFVSLRELSVATGYASSALSKMLPHLNDAGLIHAEIRREKARNGREKGNPKYYITIVDIWEVNRVFYSCSQKEQDELAELPSAQLVLKMNDLVHEKNKPVHEKNDLVSFREQDQAQVERAKDIIKDTSKDPFKDKESLSSSDDASSLKKRIADLEAEIKQMRNTNPQLSMTSATYYNATPKTLCYPFKEHPFIGVDDQYQPTLMVVTLTPAFPHPFYSEMEDKRRERIAAWEILPAYKKQGLEVQVRWEHETERQTVDAATTIIESTLPDHTAISDAHANATDGLTEPQRVNVPSTPTKPSESQLQGQESTSDESNRQATEQGQQASSDDPIASGTTKSDATSQPATKTETPEKSARKSKSEPPAGPPTMPGDDAFWNAETIVQIHEAHQGRRYPNGAKRKSDRVRDNELVSAQSLLAMTDLWTNNIVEDRQHLLNIIIQLETRHKNWWLDTNGHVMPHQLVDKDRVHVIDDEIKRRKPSNVTPMRPASNLPAKQDQTADKKALIEAAKERLARMQQQQAI